MENASAKLRYGIIGVVVVVASVGIWLYSLSGRDKPFTESEFLSIVKLKNEGIGFLENQKFGEAIKTFDEISERLPKDPFGWHNTVIGWLFQLEAQVEEAHKKNLPVEERVELISKVAEPAQAAVQKLLERHDTSVARLIAARIAFALSDASGAGVDEETHGEAIDHLLAGIKSNPRDIMVRWAYFNEYEQSDDEQRHEEAFRYLKQAHKVAPENLWLLRLLLPNLARYQDPEIRDILKKTRELTVAVRENLSPGYDLFEYLDAAEAALDKDDWKAAEKALGDAYRVMMGDVFVKSDLKACKPHPFDLIIMDYQKAVYQRAPKLVDTRVAIEVSFQPGEVVTGDAISAFQVADHNLDNRLDLFVLGNQQLTVHSRAEESNKWSPINKTKIPAGMNKMAVVDLYAGGSTEARERDFGKDTNARRHTFYLGFVVYGKSGIAVFQRAARGNDKTPYVQVKQSMPFDQLKNVTHVTPVDLEHDGDLDLVVVANQSVSLWSNRGNMTFDNISQFSTLPSDLNISGVAFGDYDRDLDMDIFLASPDGGGYLENLRHSRFRWRPFDSAYGDLARSSALALADVDGNVSWDFVGASETGTRIMTTALSRPGVSKPIRPKAVGGTPADHLLMWDYDNDGELDVLAWGKKGVRLYRAGQDEFDNMSSLIQGANEGLGCDFGDFDADGDLDLVLHTKQGLRIHRNEGGNKNNWMDVRIKGDFDTKTGRVNHYAIGSIIELMNGPRYRAQIVTRQTTHFGLGKAEQGDYLRLLLTNGIPQGVIAPKTNVVIAEKQVLLGSCPFLYTWNGDRYEFFTDLLWAAPLGLQVAQGKQAPWRAWEYIRIPGEALRATDGKYRLKITEELWEAVFFDKVQLIAVDHPADVDVYSNEKVGPAFIARHMIHTVSHPRLPVSAKDSRGNDVLPLLRTKDQKYVQAFRGRIRQGLVDKHYLELDLGKLKQPKSIKLYLHGWIHPADSSLNVAFSQNPDIEAPVPPSVQVLDKDDKWVTSIPFMGFPGGKPKTIVVDLSQAFRSDQYRLRIVTSNEIYWDSAFFTVDDPAVAVTETALPMTRAELKYRGFSEMRPRNSTEPHRYDHDRVSQEPAWPPMYGKFTRFGDVRELLARRDDMMVVMGAGDALELEFDEPDTPLPAGWKRDFLIYSDGWDKDANVNTIRGDEVGPMPFHAMKSYPYAPKQSFPQTPAHKDYLRRYQTRTQPLHRFWNWKSNRLEK